MHCWHLRADRRISAFGRARRAAALILLTVAITVASGPAHGGEAAAPATDAGLFARQAPGYDAATLGRVVDLVVAAYRDLPNIVARAVQRGRRVGVAASALIILLMLAVVLTVALRHRLAHRVHAALEPLMRAWPAPLRAWTAAAAEIAARAGPPFLLWLLHQLMQRLTGFDGPGFLIVGIMLLAAAYYQLVVTTVHELVMRPLIAIAPEHARYLYRITRWIALYGLVLYALLDAAAVLGVPGDAMALLQSLLDLSLIAMAAAVVMHKRAVLSLFPALPNRLYAAFLRGLSATYALVLALTLATVLLAWAGYVALAHAVWLRSWALVAVFLAIVFALHVGRQLLRLAIVGRRSGDRDSTRFYASAARLLDIGGIVAFTNVAIRLTGMQDPLQRVLAAPLYVLGDRTLSAAMVIEAMLVVAGFIFFARLLRDYLNYHVYPALAVDVGVANAIDVFISYALIIIGVLFALEFVGVGVGVLTVFAGALGIGLGFGLQSIANNLTSGLTLVFGRALRRGDWVAVGNTLGVIEEIGMRATTLRTRDAVDYVVPNAEFVGGTIVNWTGSSPLVREHVPVGVAHGADPDLVRSILLRVACSTAGVEGEPQPAVWFTGFSDTTLNFELLVWLNVKDVATAQVRSELYFAILQAFRTAGIDLPSVPRELGATRTGEPDIEAAADRLQPLRRLSHS